MKFLTDTHLYVLIALQPCFVWCMGAPPVAAQQVVLAHKKRSAQDLFAVIPPSLSLKPLVQLYALLEQTDNFSCVYRSLFHAQCISLALQRAKGGDTFEGSIKRLLQDEDLLNRTFSYVKEYLDKNHPTFDRTTGLWINHFLGVCAASIPLLHAQVLPIIRENNKIYAVHDPTPLLPSPLHYSSDFIKEYCSPRFLYETCRVELDGSPHLAHQLQEIDSPHRVAHFACRYPKHMFIASIITDHQGYAKLFIIDSNNTHLEHEEFKPFACKLLEYTERHNAEFRANLFKKQRSSTAQDCKK